MANIIALITAIVRFLPEIRRLIRILSDTPEEVREKILKKAEAEAESLKKTGRPKWDA